jgi:hypothetical protein
MLESLIPMGLLELLEAPSLPGPEAAVAEAEASARSSDVSELPPAA